LLLSPFPFRGEVDPPPFAFDDFIVTRFIEFFSDVIASGGDDVSDSCCDDIDDDDNERSEVEPAECTSSV
jgi:hypothetical protein